MRRVMLGGLVALALATGACGGDDDNDNGEGSADDTEAEASGSSTTGAIGGGTDDEYVAAYTDALATLGTTEEESACMASAIVDTVGADRLNEVTSPDTVSTSTFDPAMLGLDVTEAEALYDSLNQCADLLNVLVSAGGSPEIADCLRQNLDEATVRTVLVASFSGQTDGMVEAQGRLTDAYNTCSPTASVPVPTTAPSG